MSEETKETQSQPPHWTAIGKSIAQLVFGVAVIVLAIVGWQFWSFNPIIAILLGGGGLTICCRSLGLSDYFVV